MPFSFRRSTLGGDHRQNHLSEVEGQEGREHTLNLPQWWNDLQAKKDTAYSWRDRRYSQTTNGRRLQCTHGWGGSIRSDGSILWLCPPLQEMVEEGFLSPILYNQAAEKPLNQLDFHLAVIPGLLEGHTKRTDQRHLAPQKELPLRLTEWPFPEPIPKDNQYGGRSNFEVCRARKKRAQTQWQCKVCKTPLHVHPCFEIYHTKLH